jgi:hypothetical protein
MIITEHSKTADQEVVSHNDDSDLHKDEIGENSGEDTGLAKAFKEEQDKKTNSSNIQSPRKENL